jgi:ATP-dependent DNA helicase RecG
LNAVVHKDYSTGIPIQIRVYKDKVNIFNSGGLPDGWTVDKLLSWHESSPRNPLIAGAFFRSGMIETWGRGIEKIMTACREEGKPEPLFDSSQSGVRVLFTDNAQPASGIISDADIGDNIGDNLNATQQKIIDLIAEDATISARVAAEKIGITPRNVEANIRVLKKMGIVERIGSAKSGRWVIRR